MEEREFKPLKISILTISDSRTEKDDKSGKLLAERLVKSGHSVGERRICRDNIYQIRSHVSRWISDDDINVVLTTGGTGVTGRDGSPEAVLPLLDKVLDGFGEMFRQANAHYLKILHQYYEYNYLDLGSTYFTPEIPESDKYHSGEKNDMKKTYEIGFFKSGFGNQYAMDFYGYI